MAELTKLVGKNIRKIRKNQGLTQEELAERAELQHSYIGGIERGERNISLLTLEKIVNSLNIPASSLFDYSDIEIEQNESKEDVIQTYINILKKLDREDILSIYKITKDIIKLLNSK